MGLVLYHRAVKWNDSALHWCRGLRNLQSKQCEMELWRFEISHMHAEREPRLRGKEEENRDGNDCPSAAPGIDHCWGSGPNQLCIALIMRRARQESEASFQTHPDQEPLPRKGGEGTVALGHGLSQTISIRITQAVKKKEEKTATGSWVWLLFKPTVHLTLRSGLYQIWNNQYRIPESSYCTEISALVFLCTCIGLVHKKSLVCFCIFVYSQLLLPCAQTA